MRILKTQGNMYFCRRNFFSRKRLTYWFLWEKILGYHHRVQVCYIRIFIYSLYTVIPQNTPFSYLRIARTRAVLYSGLLRYSTSVLANAHAVSSLPDINTVYRIVFQDDLPLRRMSPEEVFKNLPDISHLGNSNMTTVLKISTYICTKQ